MRNNQDNGNSKNVNNWVMGLDIGTGSVAVSCYWLQPAQTTETIPIALAHLDGRIYAEPVNATDKKMLNENRRMKRLARRQIIRKARMRRKLYHIGLTMGLQPTELTTRYPNILDLRLRAVTEQLPLAQVMAVALNLLQNRGARHHKKPDGIISQAEILKTRRDKATKDGQREQWSVVFRDEDKKSAKAEAKKILQENLAQFASRQLYEDEVEKFLNEQEKHHPIFKENYKNAPNPKDEGKLFKTKKPNEIFTFRHALAEVLTYQKPIKWDWQTIGKCELKGKAYFCAPKATPAFQEFRLEQKIQDLGWRHKTEKLNPEQKSIIRQLLQQRDFVTYPEIYQALNTPPEDQFTHDKTNTGDIHSGLVGNRTAIAMEKLGLTKSWVILSPNEQSYVINFLADLQDTNLAQDQPYIHDYFYNFLSNDKSIDKQTVNLPKVKNFIYEIAAHKKFSTLSKMGFDSGRAQYSIAALQALTNEMRTDNINFYHAKSKLFPQNADDWAPPITNPVVKKSFTETMDLVQYAIKKMKKLGGAALPHNIHFEMMRELQMSADKKNELIKNQTDNRKLRLKIAKELQTANMPASPKNIKKLQLLIEQNYHCAYSGVKINLTNLDNCEIDHIRPQSQGGSDSHSNLVLVTKTINLEKGDLTPYQAFKANKLTADNWNAIQFLAQSYIKKGNNGEAVWDNYQKTLNAKTAPTNKKSVKTTKQKLDPIQIKGLRLLARGEPRTIESFELDDDTRRFQNTGYLANLLKTKLITIYTKHKVKPEIAAQKIIPIRGQITALVRQELGFDAILPQLRINEGKPLFNEAAEEIDQNDYKTFINNKGRANFAHQFYKRCDHRHHLIDAATLALITRWQLQRASKFYKRHGTLYPKKQNRFTIEMDGDLTNKIYQELQHYLKNYVLWHKPDRFNDGQFFQETCYKLGKDNKKLIIRKSLTNLGNNYDEIRSEIDRYCYGQQVKTAILQQLDQHKNAGLTITDAVRQLYYPAHTKNRIKKLAMIYHAKGETPFNEKVDKLITYASGKQSVYRNGGYACLQFTDKGFNLFAYHQVKMWQVKMTQTLPLPPDSAIPDSAKLFYKGDLVFLDAYNDFYLVKSFNAKQGMRMLLATEVVWVEKKPFIVWYNNNKGIHRIADRKTLAEFVKKRTNHKTINLKLKNNHGGGK